MAQIKIKKQKPNPGVKIKIKVAPKKQAPNKIGGKYYA